jgi:hypothetical protein
MNPNPIDGPYRGYGKVSIDLDLTGNAYAICEGMKKAFLLNSSIAFTNMTVVPEKEEDDDGHLVAGYLYSLDSPDSSYPNFVDDGRTTAFCKG